MRRAIYFSIFIVATAFVLAACSAATTAPATNTPMPPVLSPTVAVIGDAIDPCKVLVKEDIETALGESVVLNPFREPVNTGYLCGYHITSKTLVVILTQVATAEIQNTIQELMTQAKGGQPLSGIGDVAFFSFQENVDNSTSKAGIIYLMKGNSSLVISLTDANLNQTKAIDALKYLAQKAVARLP